MLKNDYLLAKIGADTAENEQHFAENLPKIGNYPTDRRGGAAPWRSANYIQLWNFVKFDLNKIEMHLLKDLGYTSKSDLSKILFYKVSKKENEWGRY